MGLIQYNNVVPETLRDSGITVSESDIGINYGEDNYEANVLQQLENPENIAIYEDAGIFIVKRQQISNLLLDNGNIRYECKEIQFGMVPRLSNLVKNRPYLTLLSIGSLVGGLS